MIRKASAHGLGHLIAPYNEPDAPRHIPAPTIELHKLGVSRWQYDLWYLAIQAVLAGTAPDFTSLPGFERPAMTSLSISTRDIADRFAKHNKDEHDNDKPYRQRIRAFGFLISPVVRADDKPLGLAGQPFHLVAPFNNDDQSAWDATTFIDIYGGGTYAISTSEFNRTTAKVSTYHEIADRYLTHPDPRRLDQRGKPCRRKTTGPLSPRHIDAIHIEQIGKETNQLEETTAGLIHDAADIYTTYTATARDTWSRFVLPVLDDIPRQTLAEQTGLAPTTLTESIADRTRPHPRNRRKLVQAAHRHARATLAARGVAVPRNKTALLHTYLQAREQRPDSRCPMCDKPTASPRATYCGPACKQSAYRARQDRFI